MVRFCVRRSLVVNAPLVTFLRQRDSHAEVICRIGESEIISGRRYFFSIQTSFMNLDMRNA